MTQVWKDQQQEYPETTDIIQEGLDKLNIYMEHTKTVPVYLLAMCMCHISKFIIFILLTSYFVSYQSIYET